MRPDKFFNFNMVIFYYYLIFQYNKTTMKNLGLLALLFASSEEVQAKIFNKNTWNYENNGLDWPEYAKTSSFNNQCGKTDFQSPIDLRTSDHSNPWPDVYETDEYDYANYN